MKFLIDNNLSPLVSKELNKLGFDSVYVKELKMQKASDYQIFDLAFKENRIIVSADTDFGFILSQWDKNLPSVILFRNFSTNPDRQFQSLKNTIKHFGDELEKGTLTLPGFNKDWAIPTFKIVRFLIIAMAVIIIYPYLPGSDSKAFEGVSILLGLVLSLASASAIANMIAGLVLTYMNAFKLGDRVKIADTSGDVVEKTLMATRIRTIKNVDITIPNAMVLSSHIINFSSSAKDSGLILHTTVTIGYDVPWQKVHELLINAALESQYINKEPKPFILQTSLDDFYVSYELNAYTSEPGIMAKIYSEIHSNIQNKFNEAGVEIMSPHYGAMRDGNQVTIPENYLPKSYQAPSFRIFPFWGDKDKPKS